MDNFMLILAYDGDNAGRLIGRAILANDEKGLSEASARINLGHEIVQRWVKEHGGSVISGGGDEGTFQVPHEAIEHVDHLRADYKFATNLTMSVGIGANLSEAGKSLLVAKFKGKNTVVQYTPDVEAEIAKVKQHIGEGMANQEEQKLGDAYLSNEGDKMGKEELQPTPQAEDNGEVSTDNAEDFHSCPYCVEMNKEGQEGAEGAEDCPYCHEMDAQANPDNHSDCPYCQQMDAEAGHNPDEEGHPEDCPYCQQMDQEQGDGGNDQNIDPTAGPNTDLPTTTDSQNFAGQDMATPDMPKPDAIQSNPDELAAQTDDETNENIKLDQEQGVNNEEISQEGDPQDQETMQSVVAEIDAIPSEEESSQTQVGDEEADSPVGDNMEGNVSRPDNYSQNVPSDMGTGDGPVETPPDITSVLQEGLDNHADNIQRERVVNMVSEALQGFKASKNIIEKAKLQAPQLYDSSIAMLRAMIEMAKLLGLDKESQEQGGSVEDAVPGGGGTPDYEAHPEAAGGGQADESALGGDGTPDYEPHPEKTADQGNGEPSDPKALGQLASR